jgi:hypothetical protein
MKEQIKPTTRIAAPSLETLAHVIHQPAPRQRPGEDHVPLLRMSASQLPSETPSRISLAGQVLTRRRPRTRACATATGGCAARDGRIPACPWFLPGGQE